jgi:hypothetical protein
VRKLEHIEHDEYDELRRIGPLLDTNEARVDSFERATLAGTPGSSAASRSY